MRTIFNISLALLAVTMYLSVSDAAPSNPSSPAPSAGQPMIHSAPSVLAKPANSAHVMGKFNGALQAETAAVIPSHEQVNPLQTHMRVKRNKTPIRYHGRSYRRRQY